MDPLTAIILIGGSLLSGLLGKPSQQTQTTTQQTQPRQSQNPMYYALLPMITQALSGRMGALSGAGMPGGIGSWWPSGMGADLKDLLARSWPDIMGKLSGGVGSSVKGDSKIRYNA
jgi:hypothetical protein